MDITNISSIPLHADEIVGVGSKMLNENINDIRSGVAKVGYYECSTQGSSPAKTISADNYILSAGGSMKVKMTNANTADNATLNINSTGAKPLFYDGERASATNSWEEGETVEVYYDGEKYYANNVAGGSGSGDGAFDVSVKYPTSGVEGGNTYTLEGALAVLNDNLSSNKKKGGMSIKFIQSIDKNYVQYMFKLSGSFTDDLFANKDNWEKVNLAKKVVTITRHIEGIDMTVCKAYCHMINMVISSGQVYPSSSFGGYNGYVIYVPATITTVYYDNISLANVGEPYIFDSYPKIGDVSTGACVVNTSKKTITLPNNDKGVYLLVNIKLSEQTESNVEAIFYANVFASKTEFNNLKAGYTRNISFDSAITGKFIVADGTIGDNPGFSYLTDIQVLKGETVRLQATGYATNVCMIGVKTGNSVVAFTPKVISVDGLNRLYEWVANRDCVIGVSYINHQTHTLKIETNLTAIVNESFSLGNRVSTLEDYNKRKLFNNFFPRIAVIGDSLSSGQLENPTPGGTPSSYGDIYGQSWLSCIARIINADARTHYSEAGLTCQGWLHLHQETWGWPSTNYLEKMQSDNAFNAYFIALGTNDITRGTLDPNSEYYYPLGNISDAAGDNSFIGYYKQIIEAVRAKAPYCVLFCLSMYQKSGSYANYSAAVQQICGLYDNAFYVDFANNSDVLQSGGKGTIGFHFSTWGYQYIADIILGLVNNICLKNPTFFKIWGLHNSVGEKYNA